MMGGSTRIQLQLLSTIHVDNMKLYVTIARFQSGDEKEYPKPRFHSRIAVVNKEQVTQETAGSKNDGSYAKIVSDSSKKTCCFYIWMRLIGMECVDWTCIITLV
ncbi:uncharacterized protein [Rutidosis leptorrhynchoides]|uniref:uncharacterized protein isoform X2 n=1 Tax=Rutidosis leptorrhynchoides TaxID=125765 RepID=UPI003A9A0807